MILELLKQDDYFTNTELEVVRFIRNDITRIPLLNISDLADLTYSSNATIIRVCKKLNCKGFSDLKIKLVKEAESLKYIKQSVDFSAPFSITETTYDVINNMGSLYKETIDILNSNINIEELEKVIDIIYSSRRIYLYGQGDSLMTMKAFINKLMKLNFYAICATDNYEENAITQTITKDDCVILCSYRGHILDSATYIPMLLKSHAKIIGITAQKNTRVSKISDYVIYIPNLEDQNKIGTFYSQLGLNYILNLFYSLLYLRIAKTNRNFKPVF